MAASFTSNWCRGEILPLTSLHAWLWTHPLCSSSSLMPRDVTTLLKPRWLRLMASVKLWLYSAGRWRRRAQFRAIIWLKHTRTQPLTWRLKWKQATSHRGSWYSWWRRFCVSAAAPGGGNTDDRQEVIPAASAVSHAAVKKQAALTELGYRKSNLM